MVVETVPVVGVADGIPRPVRSFKVFEDDAGITVFIRTVAPDIKISQGASWLCAPSALKPRMLIRGVIEDKLCNYTDSAAVRFAKESLEIGQGSVRRMHAGVVGDVVTVVL